MSDVYVQFGEALGELIPDADGAPASMADIPAETLAQAAAATLGVPYHESLASRAVSHEFLAQIPISYARQHHVLGLVGEDGEVEIAMSALSQWPLLSVLDKCMALRVKPVFAPKHEILKAINAAYQQQRGQAQQVIESLDADAEIDEVQRIAQGEDLLDVASRAPVIQLVNLALFEAVKRRASDVHIQGNEESLVIRFRIDGVLHDVYTPPKALHEEILSRIKVMGQMNIAERRLAQDGRCTVEVGDRIVDLRISTIPTSFGERAVIRLLDKSARLYELGELSMPPSVLDTMRRLIRMDHGIVLVTGPTGSGKTTTLYAALRELNTCEQNILTLEDPIEYRLEGISQTQVSDRKGMTFASGLRHVLRQDPDIIMVGEIRDSETARMAIQSALTGHLVFSTLHTNDAAGAVARLLDLGVEPYLVSSSLLAVLAQRLVRGVCPECRTEFEASEEEIQMWGRDTMVEPGQKLYRGQGCDACLNTGYSSRVGIFELLRVTDSIRERIHERSPSGAIKKAAIAEGMKSLRSAAIDRALRGQTTMNEVARVTGRDEM
jgi:general secretion pathway protein E